MAAIEIQASELPPLVRDTGLLVGLLTQQNQSLVFETSWFADPGPSIEAIPKNHAGLMALLRDLLGTPAPNTPSDRDWYALDWEGKPSGVYVVLPTSDSGASSTIGVGLLHDFTEGELEVELSAYVPLFSIPVGDPVIVTGEAGFPVELVLTLTGQAFSAANQTFTGLSLEGDIVFTGAPSFSLSFLPAGSQPPVTTLAELQAAAINAIVNAALGTATVKSWLATPIAGSPVTVGAVLSAVGILQGAAGSYTFGSFSELEGKTPLQIAELLLAAGLKLLASIGKPIVAFGGGGIWIFGETSGTSTSYGLRLQVPDVDVSPSGGPSVLLQLGKGLSTDTTTTWIGRSDPKASFPDPGLSLALIAEDASNVPSFAPFLDLVDVGIDLAGSSNAPLFDVDGAQVGGFEARLLLSLDFADLSKIPWGVAVGCDGLGIPLGNSLTTSTTNPVAQSLLSSGSSGDTEPVNPTFDVSVGKVFDPASSTSLDVQLVEAGSPAGTIWIPVQRAFGPLHCSRLGVEWPQPNPGYVLTFLFDGGVTLSALEVDLVGLSLGIPLTAPGDVSDYELGLDGLAVSYASGPLSISGGMIADKAAKPLEYEGEALIKVEEWAIAAFGAYASLDGEPSLFIFAQVDAPIGGPPFFFVTGLCFGFGYNRSLKIPAQDQVPSFPLLAGVSDPSKIGGPNASPAQALTALSDWVQPAQGVDWVAAGVQFSSFELIQSNVVLVVIVGKDFEAAVLGLSRLKLPQEGPVQFAYVELGLEVVLHPSAGFFGASAVLTPNSYILDPACHLTGGFAFWTWYDGPHAGDFVVTVGGYHPAFTPPPWYPEEPRLGFSWHVSDVVTISGDAYFALTPSCVMGGGGLAIVFEAGNLRAWFTAQADFLFQWKPFYFMGDVGVSIGVSYKLDLLFVSVTLTVELGAQLEIYGPPVGGKVHIDWFIISFTVPFGAGPGTPAGYVDWDGFSSLLPQNKPAKAPALAAAVATDEVPLTNVIKLTISDGLVRTDGTRWLVRGDTLGFGLETAFPLTELDLAGPTTTKYTPPTPSYFVAVAPMGVAGTNSTLTLTVTGGEGVENLGEAWNWTPTLRAVPKSLWGPPPPEHTAMTTPSAETLPGRLVGATGLAPKQSQPVGPPPMQLANLAHDPIDPDDSDYLPLSATAPLVARQPKASPTSLTTIADTISTSSVQLRGEVFAALQAFGYDAGANGTTADIAAAVDLSYPSPPLLGAPWQGAS